MKRRTLYVTGFATWPAPTPARKRKKPCDHPRLRTDGHCAGCQALIYDRQRAKCTLAEVTEDSRGRL